jgi:hypothetical protein
MVGNTSFESVATLKYFGMALSNPSCIHDEIMNIQNSTECPLPFCLELQPASLFSENTKINTHKTIILPVILHGIETWSLSFREEHWLMVFENRVLRKILGLQWD